MGENEQAHTKKKINLENYPSNYQQGKNSLTSNEV